jgi:hypothetical protein
MCNVNQDSPGNKPPRETPSRKALRMEARGLILIALVIFVVYLVRYFHLVHRSAH